VESVTVGGPGGRAVVTGEGAADGTGVLFRVLPWDGFGVRFGIFGLKVSLLRPV